MGVEKIEVILAGAFGSYIDKDLGRPARASSRLDLEIFTPWGTAAETGAAWLFLT